MNKIVLILDNEDAAFLSTLGRILGAVGAAAAGRLEAEANPTAPVAVASLLTEPALDAGNPDGRRRRRTKLEMEAARAAEASAAPAADPTPASSSSTRRPRTTGATTSIATEETRTPRTASETAPTAAVVERRRRGTNATAPVSDEITDADLVKAASTAAAKLTPGFVMQILQEDHGVAEVNKIPQGQRRKFLDTLKEEMAG